MFKLRDYQKEGAKQGLEILQKHHILILCWAVRTGKSHTALEIASNYNDVLFITKKKAISSIESDYQTAGHSYNLTVINYESVHKVKGFFDLVIVDESHNIGAFPKPSKRTKEIRKHVTQDLILMTGTLLPESNSQIFHQLWISPHSPFKHFKNFYAWHKKYGELKQIYTSYGQANDYSVSIYVDIYQDIKPFLLTRTQSESGFKSEISERVHLIDMNTRTKTLYDRLRKDLVIEGNDEVILADTEVKLMQKLHQLSAGTIKFESGNSMVLDTSIAEYIRQEFDGKKLAIFYKFKEELIALKMVFNNLTQDIDEFNSTDKHIALQIVSGREGVNLSAADELVYYNIDFSAVSYFQSRDRLTTIDRPNNTIHWIFTKEGLGQKIYKQVMNKKSFTLQTFRKL